MQVVRRRSWGRIMLTRQGAAVINPIKITSHSDNIAANPGDTYPKL
jgi:hypothetical protein